MAEDSITIPGHDQLSRLLGWANEAIEEGEAFLRAQPGFDKIDKSIRRVMSDIPELVPTALSRVSSNRFAHIYLSLSASLTDIKPFVEYKTENKDFEKQASMANKRIRSWWLDRQIDMRFLDVMKWSLVGASGYGHLVYNHEFDDMDLLAEDPRDVLPIRPASNMTMQDCFAVLIRRERTVNWATGIYPHAEGKIKPDRSGYLAAVQKHTIITAQVERMGLDASPFWNRIDRERRATSEQSIPTVDVFTLYVKDRSRNKASFPVTVGSKDFGYKYEVAPGDLLYPRLRRIVFTRSVILSDDPSPYWHGQFPLVRLTLDPAPWSWLGKAPMWDLLPLQEEYDRIWRVIGDRIQKVAQPDLAVNAQAISRAEFDRINTRLPGLKLRLSPLGGQNPVVSPQFQPLESWILEILQKVTDEMDTLSGVQDISNVVRLNQIPSSETIERMLEALTPLVRMRSRVIEAILRPFAMMQFSNFLQFDTLPRRLRLLGKDGLTFEDADYDPGNLIPAQMNDDRGKAIGTREGRARHMLSMFTYNVAPGSLLSASEITDKMLHFQLWRAGLIDPGTLADKLNIANYGTIPGETIIEKLKWTADNLPQPNVSPAGRKSSGQQAPRLVVKES